MASDRQIAANRANALRSTGPKTAEGKQKASRNAFRHGLSRRPIKEDAGSVEELAGKFANAARDTEHAHAYLSVARACLEIRRVRSAQASLLFGESDLHRADVLKALKATERYERRALTARHRAVVSIQRRPSA